MIPTPFSRAVALTLIPSVALLAACGGGGGSGGSPSSNSPGSTSGSPPTASQTTVGVWKGTITSTTTGQSSVMVAFDGGDGHVLWMTADGRVYDGTMPTSAADFEAQMTAHMDLSGHFPDGTNVGAGSMMIDSHTSSMMGGRYSGGGDAGTFTMNLNPMWNRQASLTTAAATYTRSSSDGYTMTMTISANGQLTGSDSDGCQLSGTVTVPDASHNLYGMEVTVTSCGALDGTYHGMGALLDADQMQDWMTAMHPFEHGGTMMGGSGMMGGGSMMGYGSMPTGAHNLFMFSLANAQNSLMDALAR